MSYPRSVILAALAALAAGAAAAGFDPAKVAIEPAPVAARFPDPPVTYDTPAFAAGKSDFTSQTELMAYVEALHARAPQRMANARGSPVSCTM